MRIDNLESKIILASASPRRKELMEQIGLSFTVEPSDAEENIGLTDPKELVAELSKLKADDVWKKHPENCIVAADTVVSINGKVLGKPKDRDDGKKMLEMLSGNKHTVYTGVTVMDKNGAVTKVAATDVYFKKLSQNDIEKYLDTNEYADKAGAYGIQGHAARFAEKICGCYFNVVGLPLSLLDDILSEKGVN